MSFDADVEGAAAFSTSLGSAAAQLADLTDAGRVAGSMVAREAGPRTPRRTGRLGASAHITAEREVVTVAWGAPYAAYVNFGTRRMRARAFATDALEAATDQIGAAYAAAVADAIDTVHT